MKTCKFQKSLEMFGEFGDIQSKIIKASLRISARSQPFCVFDPVGLQRFDPARWYFVVDINLPNQYIEFEYNDDNE
jgi:hypothetical protein